MHVAPLQDPDELSSLFVATARAAGVAANDDVSGPAICWIQRPNMSAAAPASRVGTANS
jgi:hypothetical protein